MESSGLLYHEVQESKLCAVHCLNTVLQGPYFSEVELGTIAKELDDREREILGSSEEHMYMSEGSSNVALDGNFSIQVVEKALSALELKCVSLEAPEAEEARAAPYNQHAFICNLQEHWFTIRKVCNKWYNFNSLFAAPEHLSDFYLSAYLDSLKASGWSIFVVLGTLPNGSLLRNFNSESRFGKWLTAEQASAILHSAKETEEKQDPMLEAALAASLADYSGFPESPGLGGEDSSELAAALAASLADVRPPLKE